MSVVLRPASEGDLEVVAAVWADGWRDGHVGHVPEAMVALRTRESFRVRTGRHLAETTVAEVDGRVAGFVMVSGDEVAQVFVAAESRGSGVAGTLLAEAERLVAAGGFQKAWLAVVPGNARARRFYERSGWADDGGFSYEAESPAGTVSVPCRRYTKAVG